MTRPCSAIVRATAIALVALAGACYSAPEPSPQARSVAEWSDAEILAEGARYLDDARFRRAALEGSLANRDNLYSRQRLDGYALGTKGWDLLPEYNPRSVPVTRDHAAELGEAGTLEHVELGSVAPIWDGRRPATMDEWIALGREVFVGYPLRADPALRFAIARGELGDRFGVRAAADGTYPGVRLFVDPRGETAIGITCALCHSSVDGGQVRHGVARRSFDYGGLRLAWHEASSTPVEPDLARRMRGWGPGRADVTEDEDQDPVAIPDLWGIKEQSALTQAGTIVHTGPAALAVRQETQLLHASGESVRPPRELAFALATYLYSLAPAARAPEPDVRAERGKALFAEHCATCHSNRALGGAPVDAARVGTDPALARGAARGTGKYRPPALLRVSDAAPYFHDGSVATLADLLSPQRLEASFARSPLGPGPVRGHVFGTTLAEDDRAALVAFLKSL